MDLETAIRELYSQKEKLDRVIAQLEEVHRAAGGSPFVPRAPQKRRGRKKPMSALERKEVSERMKAYWRKRKKSNPSA
jgi:hypothetical protein